MADLERQLAEARKECLRYESEIAEVCPEDLTLKETIVAVKRESRKQAFEDAAKIAAQWYERAKAGRRSAHAQIVLEIEEALRREATK